MDEIRFSGVEELYRRLLPALKSKKKEMHYYMYRYVTENDIWNYLRETKWQNRINLTLYDMVDDILHTDNELIDEYTKKEITKSQRNNSLNDNLL